MYLMSYESRKGKKFTFSCLERVRLHFYLKQIAVVRDAFLSIIEVNNFILRYDHRISRSVLYL